MLAVFLKILCLLLISTATAGDEIVAKNDSALLCGSLACPLNTLMCIYTEKSSDDLTSVAKCATCMSYEGKVLLEKDLAEPNVSRNQTNIFSMTISGLNISSQQQKEYTDRMVDLTKLYINQQLPPSSPTVQVFPVNPTVQTTDSSSTAATPTPQQIFISIPTPPIAFYNPVLSFPPGYTVNNNNNNPPVAPSVAVPANENIMCVPPGCPFPNYSSNQINSNDNPNMQPSPLSAAYDKVSYLRTQLENIEQSVNIMKIGLNDIIACLKDGSAGVPPPIYDPTNKLAFPVDIPYGNF